MNVTVEAVVHIRIHTNSCSNKILEFVLLAVNDSDGVVPADLSYESAKFLRLSQEVW